MPDKPQTIVKYYVVDIEPYYPTYEDPKYQYRRVLRWSNTTIAYDVDKEDLIKVAVTVCPLDGTQLNTDPIALTKWNNGAGYEISQWGQVQDWLFYDPTQSKLYHEGEPDKGIVGDETNVKTGGFMKLDLTYFYYDSSNKYTGKGTWNETPETNTATLIAPTNDDNKVVDDQDYTITWNGTGWTCIKKDKKNEIDGDLYITGKLLTESVGVIYSLEVDLSQSEPQDTQVAVEANSTYIIIINMTPTLGNIVTLSGHSIFRVQDKLRYPLPVWDSMNNKWWSLMVSFIDSSIKLSTTETALQQKFSVSIIKLDGNGIT